MFLAERPFRAVLQCSRRLTQAEIDTRKNECMEDAANGTVFITAAISEGEKQIARALREAEYPLIILLENGFPKPDDPHYKYFKPSGVYFEACAAGKLLLVEPHPDLFELPEVVAQVTTKTGNIPHDTLRYRFVALNVIASRLSSSVAYITTVKRFSSIVPDTIRSSPSLKKRHDQIDHFDHFPSIWSI